MTMYEKYCQLEIDSKWIGLEKSDTEVTYFCTPVNAQIIGWENCIHYCFLSGYNDMVFAVNPETCVDQFVYPLAMNFTDFLRLILSCGSTTAVEQIIGWSKEQFANFVVSDDNAIHPKQQKVLDVLKTALKLEPIAQPYEYVTSVQEQFNSYNRGIEYSNEYYDTLGLERPDGTESIIKPFAFEPTTFTFVIEDK